MKVWDHELRETDVAFGRLGRLGLGSVGFSCGVCGVSGWGLSGCCLQGLGMASLGFRVFVAAVELWPTLNPKP